MVIVAKKRVCLATDIVRGNHTLVTVCEMTIQ